MEGTIVFVIIAVIVIVNVIRTYKKEANKNKERTLSSFPRPIITSVPAPFSRPQQVNETSRNPQYQSTPSAKPAEYNFANEGVSAIQQHIDRQAQSAFRDDENFVKDEDSKEDAFDLKLNTAEDFKRAFVHTLIFERRY